MQGMSRNVDTMDIGHYRAYRVDWIQLDSDSISSTLQYSPVLSSTQFEFTVSPSFSEFLPSARIHRVQRNIQTFGGDPGPAFFASWDALKQRETSGGLVLKNGGRFVGCCLLGVS